ncbi:MAG: hypothetical protein M3176_18125, partial [Chloroflexota bacterium]|nr:hypothetical protein [Chloroflexota bacterium]
RTALLAALPPDVPDRGDALLDALQTARRREMDTLRALTIAAIRDALRRTDDAPAIENAPAAS